MAGHGTARRGLAGPGGQGRHILRDAIELEIEDKAEEVSPRLYSRPTNEIVETIAEQHEGLHASLDSWGRWCRDRYEPKTCESAEYRYDEPGWREVKPPILALPENPLYRQIDRGVRYMRMWMPMHGEALVFYYVGERKGMRYFPCPPWRICKLLHEPRPRFNNLMFYARAGLRNIMYRLGN